MGILESIVTFFQTGGIFMYPILIVFAIGVAIAAERYIKLNMVKMQNRKVWGDVYPILEQGNFD